MHRTIATTALMLLLAGCGGAAEPAATVTATRTVTATAAPSNTSRGYTPANVAQLKAVLTSAGLNCDAETTTDYTITCVGGTLLSAYPDTTEGRKTNTAAISLMHEAMAASGQVDLHILAGSNWSVRGAGDGMWALQQQLGGVMIDA